MIEVKSRLTEPQLEDAVAKIASFKKLHRPAVSTVTLAPGVVVGSGVALNPQLGVVVAHAYGDDLQKLTNGKLLKVESVINSVPRAEQVDALLVLGEDCYLRARAPGTAGPGVHVDS